MEEKKASNIFAIIGLVLNLIGFFIFPLVFGTAGLICSIVGYTKADELRSGKGLAIAGIILGVINVLWAIGRTLMLYI